MSKITIDIELAKSVLTPEEALSLLSVHTENRKKRVHTFVTAGFALIGCDVDLRALKKEITAASKEDLSNVRLSGRRSQAMGHGVAFFNEKEWVFLETDTAAIEAFAKKRGINLKTYRG